MKILFCLSLLVPISAQGAPLNFTEAMRTILERSTSIPQAEEFKKAADTRTLQKRLFFLPDLALSHSTTKTYRVDSEYKRLSLNSNLNLFKSGGDLSGFNASLMDREAIGSTLSQTTLSAEAEAAQGIFLNIQQAREYEILQKMYQVNVTSLKTADLRFKKGMTPSQEVDRVKVQLENAKARLNDSSIALEEAKAQLTVLLGHADVDYVWPWKTFFEKGGHKNMLEQALFLMDRPDYKKGHFEVERNQYAVTEKIRSSFFPSVDLNVSYGYLETGGPRAYEWTSVLVFTIPLFDRLADYSGYRDRESTLIASRYVLERTKRDALAEWQAKQKNFKEALQTAMLREKTLALSRQLYADNYRRFEQGRSSVNDLSLDQNRLLDSENLALQGWAQAHNTYLQLCHSLGKRLNDCI